LPRARSEADAEPGNVADDADLAALALRLNFLFHALRLGLLPGSFALPVELLTGDPSGTALPQLIAELRERFLEARHSLALDCLDWPVQPDTSLSSAADRALDRCDRDASPRARAGSLGRFCEASCYSNRRASGSYYTPGWIADDIARTVVRGVLAGRAAPSSGALELRVLDPAVGAGAFALAAIWAIAEAAGEGRSDDEARRSAARDCVFAMELSQLAADACRLAVWLAVSRPGRFATIPHDHITAVEALSHPPQPGSFDIVMGNPPWGVKLAPRQARQLAVASPSALSGHRDSYLFFLHLAASCARDNGAIGLVLPDTVLYQVRYEGMRRFLLGRFRPLKASLLGGDVFPGATAPACILCMAGKEIAPSADSPRAPHASLLPLPAWFLRLYERLANTLPQMGGPDLGFTFHDVGINYPRAEIGRAALYSGERQTPRDIPVTRGRDFGPFAPIGHSAWLRHDWRNRIASPADLSVREETFRITPKLLFRQTADRPMATIDRRGVYFGRSVIAITAYREEDLLFMCALLNSRVFAALYRAVTPEHGRSFAQVKVSKLTLLPVPTERRDELARLAAALLGEASPRERAALVSRLDAAVYAAYGLSDAEVASVEETAEPCLAVHARARRFRRGATS